MDLTNSPCEFIQPSSPMSLSGLPRTGFRYLVAKMVREGIESVECDEMMKRHGDGSPTITTSSS
jgi:hypothetical protein